MRLRLDGFDVVSLFIIGSILGLLLSLLAVAGCVPETDLTKEPRAPAGGGDGAPGPANGVLVDPAAGATEVPVNLAAVVIRFPAPLSLPAEALRICDGTGGPAALGTVGEAPCPDGACYRVPLAAPLPPAATCRVELLAGALDGDGQDVPPGLIGVFDTASAADTTPPVLTGVSVQVAGPCIGVRFSTDEPAGGAVVLRADGVEISVPAGAGQTEFDVAVPVALLPPATAATVTARATDRAGNTVESAPLALTTPPPIPPLVVTEVLANPAGTEPAQEFVEIRNVGADAVALGGLLVQDSRGADMLPEAELAAGAYALIVTSAYDPAGGVDPAPRPGTMLLRIDARIGTDGLSNGGEAVRLVEGETVVSSYGGWVAVSSSAWSGRSVHRLVETACDRPDAWSRAPLEPTPGGPAP